MTLSFSQCVIIIYVLWIAAGAITYQNLLPAIRKLSLPFIVLGILTLAGYIVQLWITSERPPLRTMGETRLLYALLLSLVGLFIHLRWKISWLLVYSLAMAMLFLGINILHPEVFDQTLMPALQSPWFIPHVVVYIEAYALLAAATLVAAQGLIYMYRNKNYATVLEYADKLVYIGYGFLCLGLLMGALWAKAAWGHYWTWDPKETWAYITWLCYLAYIHIRHYKPLSAKLAFWILIANFIVLLICWFGLNYLPSSQQSLHKYS